MTSFAFRRPLRALTTMPARLARRGSLAGACLLLAGCGSLTQTPYERPELDIPAQWQATAAHPASAQAAPAAIADDAWWEGFNDPVLNQLVTTMLERNNDLAAAALRLRRAQLQAGLARTDLFPQASGRVGAQLDRPMDGGSSQRSYSWSFGLNYEVDLWGRLARQRDAADWAAAASAADLRSTELLLIGTTLDLYWNAAFLRQQISVSEASIEYAERTRELVETQYEAGAASGLERAEAQRNLLQQQNELSQLHQQLRETQNALAVLLDGPPGDVVPLPSTLPVQPLPPVAAGLPAEVLARRPDLRAAEYRLRQALAQTDATRTSFYPSLSLTGSLGGASAALANLLQNPVAALGAGLALPFLEWQRMQQTTEIAETDYATAVVEFRQTLYEALAEVENALSARVALAEQARLLNEALDASRTTEELYEVRYRAGAVPLKDWLDAQERRRAAELAVARNRLERYANQVLLYQALGGDAEITGANLDSQPLTQP